MVFWFHYQCHRSLACAVENPPQRAHVSRAVDQHLGGVAIRRGQLPLGGRGGDRCRHLRYGRRTRGARHQPGAAFGGFFDSVLDRYSDLALYIGLLVYYAGINRFFYIVLTAIVMMGSVMVSYTRARAENAIPKCKVGFLERPERVVLIIIGALFDRMAAVLWVIAVLSNVTVIHRMIYTFQQAKRLDLGGSSAPGVK